MLQPARLHLMFTLDLPERSCLMRFSAMRRRMAKFWAPSPVRIRQSSSRKGHVQHPVATVLYAPVGTDGGIESVGAECEAADAVAPFDALLALAFSVDHLAGAVNADHAAQSRPWWAVLGQGLQIVSHRADPALHAAMPLVHRRGLLQWRSRRVRVVGVKQLLEQLLKQPARARVACP